MRIINEGTVSTDLYSVSKKYIGSIEELIRMIRVAQVAELDATNLYEQIAETVDELIKNNENQRVVARIPEFNKIISTMKDIADEEKVHSGELQKLLKLLDSSDDEFYLQGREEVGDI